MVVAVSPADKPLLVVAGPTASGKTALALHLAKKFNGEIISCDSVAVYRLMDIGSAKPSAEERARVPHHSLDLYWPNEYCTAGDYARSARAAIADVSARDKLPIIAGGTGLYLRALLQGLAPAPPRDEPMRDRLRVSEAKHGAGHLHRMLSRLDKRAAEGIHANDTPKLIRSLEVFFAARVPQTEQWSAGREPLRGFRVLQFGLEPTRQHLYARINERAAAMFAKSLVGETDMLRTRFGEDCRSLQALGYAQAMKLLRGESTCEEAIEGAQQGHRNYAKRQLTWFRRDPEMIWLKGFGSDQEVQREAAERAVTHIREVKMGATA